MSRLTRFLSISFLVLTPAIASAQGINEVVGSMLGPRLTGVVVAVAREDSTEFLRAFGHRAEHPDSALSPGDVFAFPGLSELMVGVMVGALDSAGVVDEDAPLSTYMPSLSPAVGRATLRELLTNTAGLDNARRIKGESWKRTLDRIDDNALVAEPGTFYSESRHSLPLAVRVIEHVTGRPFDAFVSAAILKRLGMSSSTFNLAQARAEGLVSGVTRSDDPSNPTRLVDPADTVDGLPVLFTTTHDVLHFLSVWLAGGLRTPGPGQGPLADRPDDAGWRYGAGMSVGEYRGMRLVRLMGSPSGVGTSAGFYLLPDSRTAVFIWSVGGWPGPVGSFTLARVADAFGAPPDTAVSRRTDPPDSTTFPLPDPREWAGTYRNGDRIFVLREADGALAMFDGSRDLALTAEGPNTMAAHVPDGRVAVRFDLLRDASGRRFLYYANLAYRHEDDPIGP